MDERQRKHISKFLSLVLRHQPEAIGIQLDANGWVCIDTLLRGMADNGKPITRMDLQDIVDTSDKQRFSISSDELRIRANQGHSVEVDLGYAPATPPEVLYHGTGERSLAAIMTGGLVKGARHHVHLSANRDTARTVGTRHGVPVVLVVHAGKMARDGYLFYLSANGVWLTEQVPVAYLEFPSSDVVLEGRESRCECEN